jgi:predicted O-methyltransferase YrrM
VAPLRKQPLSERIQHRIARRAFEWGQRLSVNVTPRHFYSATPDVVALRSSDDWKQPHSMIGVRGTDIEEQLRWVRSCCPPELGGRLAEAEIYGRACAENGEVGYGPIEADLLYCLGVTRRPRRVVQIGAGVSTSILLRVAKEGDFSLELVCIEPYPNQFIERQAELGRIRLIRQGAQSIPLHEITELGPNALLFVDSTHAVRPGSEVNRIMLEALPRLPTGTLVHFHDITFPYDYSPRILEDDIFFWGESTLLHAFLTDNPRYTIRASLSMLHDARPERLRELLPAHRPARHNHGLVVDPAESADCHFPSATYLEVIG